MRHISTTPFGRRPVTAGLLARQTLAEAPAPAAAADKWQILRDLTESRAHFQITDRDLAVLSALLSFHPEKQMRDDAALIVFPSNESLSSRAHGMAESTLRRHLAALVNAGLILRHDSPNGKRYAMRNRQGGIATAFGFDLRPLLLRSPEIAQAAQQARIAAETLREARQELVLLMRDISKLWLWAIETYLQIPDGISSALADLQRGLRRKLDIAQVKQMTLEAQKIRDVILAQISCETAEPSANDSQNERHIQNSDSYLQESESLLRDENSKEDKDPHSNLSLDLILKAAPEISTYSPDPIRSWRDFFRLAAFVSPMLGIDQTAWRASCNVMGDEAAATTVACILQRVKHIPKPGAYLHSLTKKARLGRFSPRPMVMALLNAREAEVEWS